MEILGIAIDPLLVSELSALATVIVIDLVLAGDNAVVVGMAAAGLPAEMRGKAIVFGIAAAAALRIVFAVFTTQLLSIIGLMLAGGLLLLWVAWKLWRELRAGGHREAAIGTDALDVEIDAKLYGEVVPGAPGAAAFATMPRKTMRQALTQIVIADVSMSLDNVLAVAGTAREHIWVLIVGLTLSVALMGLAATVIAGLLKKYPWISYLGLALIAWVALMMIWDGGNEVFRAVGEAGMI
jgi:YjbE family integral membrane protein